MLVHFAKRHLIQVVLGLLVLLFFLVHTAGWREWRFVERLENFAYDVRLAATMPRTQDERIVILDIDEKSLEAEGRWPWGRDKLARLVDRLFEEYEIALLAFDVVFAEPDESSGFKVLENLADTELKDVPRFRQKLESLRPRLDRDHVFAESLRGRPVILGFFFTPSGEKGKIPEVGKLPRPLFEAGTFAGRDIAFLEASGYGANLPELQDAAMGAGHFTPEVDEDGVVRRVPMLYRYQGDYYEQLALAVVRTYLGVPVQPGYPEDSVAGGVYSGMEWLALGRRKIPVDDRARTLVPYRGAQGSFPYVSATDALHGRAKPAVMKDRIALVGSSAAGLQDLRSTPVQPAYPGVEINANLISGMLGLEHNPPRTDLKQNPPYTRGAEIVLLVISGFIMALVLPALSAFWATLTTAFLVLAVVGTNVAIWHYGNTVLSVASGLMMILALFLLNMSWGYFVEYRGKRQLAGLFGQYVPPELVDELSENPHIFTLEGESREMTVLFTDVRGFTTISEGLNPRELKQLMNEFLTPMTHIIHEFRGTIDKYMGDAIMAFWGAPLPDPEHARHAMQAAMKMIAELEVIQPKFRERGWPDVHIGVGINTGLMNVGNMGSEFRMAYTVLGDAVNLGSRLEGLTKRYGVNVIVNETTRDAVPDYVYRELDRVRVKGKDRPVTIYEPLGSAEAVDKRRRDELELYHKALKLYRAQDWDMAEIQFLNLEKAAPERSIYKLYRERIAYFRHEAPPADWDGVFTYESK